MVFFNYSTMQMAAKVVYYGPGLCGKTTNLHQIYGQTSSECRGEMVSLETETDRTLFFDLLPIDVGQIAGFNTRIQLYTVPGQVFYNNTRKLVLKGVDGVVFVADSQRAMLQANADALANLDENLSEMGLDLDEIPLVLQYNKRDLDDILSVDELNQTLNPDGKRQFFEASALNGEGVFETLKGISKLTLLALKQRLAGKDRDVSPTAAAPQAPPAQPARPTQTAAPAAAPARPEPTTAQAKETVEPPTATAPPQAARVRKTTQRDVLSELEKLRRETMGRTSRASAAGPPRKKPAAAASPTTSNGQSEIRRDIQLTLAPGELQRARRFSLTLQVEDADRRVMESVEGLTVDLADTESLQKLLLRLNIALASRGS